MDEQQEFVLQTIEEQGIGSIRLWFSDVLGTLKSVSIAPAELEGAFEEGIGFDGSAIEGLTRVSEDDMIVRPDASTFQILPWEGQEEGRASSARMFCDILTTDGSPAMGDSRYILKRTLEAARQKGFTPYLHPEIEFYLFHRQERADQQPVPIDHGGYFDDVPLGEGLEFRKGSISQLESMGINVEYSHHESGPGQQEIDLRSAEALATADNIMTFRAIVRQMGQAKGLLASFMPKPLEGQPGSGMHTHLSLFASDRDAFHEAGAPFGMSATARQFAAGLLVHATEISAVVNPSVNSYKRLWGGAEAPSYVCWGHNNRSALLRVPQYRHSERIEYRALDPSVNPYLAFSLLIAAGLDGIDKEMDLEQPTNDDVWDLTDTERRAMGIQPLPASLDSALKVMEKSEFVASTLGEQVFSYFLANKHRQWQEYRSTITPYELRTSLDRM